MTRERNYSKAAFILATGAFLISAGNAGAPAIAKVVGGNSDTVDGFHAVKAGSTVDQRKGKLVATSPKTGLLPNNIIKTARDSRLLAGKPPSHYATQADLAASVDVLTSVPGEVYQPVTGEQRSTLFSRPFTQERAGKVLASTAFQVAGSCASASAVASWLTIDDVYVSGSLFFFNQSGSSLTTAVLAGTTESVVAAGEHTIKVWIGCTESNIVGSTLYYPDHIQLTTLGAS